MANRNYTLSMLTAASLLALASGPAAAQTFNTSGDCVSVDNCAVENSVSVDVDAPGLAALAPSDCVLSETHSGGVSVGTGTVGVGVSYGMGKTTPYDECNTREAIKVMAQVSGTIDGVPTNQIVAEMLKSLTGVQQAIDGINGVEPPQTSEVVAEVQTAQRPKVWYGSNR